MLKELSTKKGRGTELVTLYVPPKKSIHEVIGVLRDEHGTASNIKSDITRNHVQDALVKTMQRLKLYKITPQNGLVIFCGALPTNGPGSEFVFIYDILPPKEVQTYLYRCDDHFHLEILRDMLREEKIIGLLSIDATEAGMGIISGTSFEVIDKLSSGVGGKHRAGGQSARRFERLREMNLTDYYHRIANHAVKSFLEDIPIQALIVSGPGGTKDTFLKQEYLDYRLQKKVVAVLDTAYSGSEGLRETVDKANQILQGIRIVEEKKLIQRFLSETTSQNGLAIYGTQDIMDSLQKANVELILISEDLDWTYLKVICKSCKSAKEKVLSREKYVSEKQNLITTSCSTCSSTDQEIVEIDFIEYLADLASESSAKVEVISSKTEEGAMLKSFGGFAAFKRYNG